MSTIEKIVHLQNLEEALLRKIEKFEKSKEIKNLQRVESVQVSRPVITSDLEEENQIRQSTSLDAQGDTVM